MLFLIISEQMQFVYAGFFLPLCHMGKYMCLKMCCYCCSHFETCPYFHITHLFISYETAQDDKLAFTELKQKQEEVIHRIQQEQVTF